MSQIIHSFIVKIWRGESEKGKPFTWHGYITHVPDNERHYLRSVREIGSFIKGYLQQMGVRVDPWWKLRQKLKRRKPKK